MIRDSGLLIRFSYGSIHNNMKIHRFWKYAHIYVFSNYEIYDRLYSFLILFYQFFFFRTKWKRQTAVGLELLAEAGNYAAVQRMLQTNPYWGAYSTHTAGIMSNLDAMYFRHGAGLAPQRPMLPRMFIHGLQQYVSHIPPPGPSPTSIYSSSDPRSTPWRSI